MKTKLEPQQIAASVLSITSIEWIVAQDESHRSQTIGAPGSAFSHLHHSGFTASTFSPNPPQHPASFLNLAAGHTDGSAYRNL